MIIYFIFSVVNSTLIEQSFTIKQENQALLYLSAIQQYSTNYNFGVLNFNLSINASKIYQLIYIPDSSSEEYYCFTCFNESKIFDDQKQCQEKVLEYIHQNLIGNNKIYPTLICYEFQNLSIQNYRMNIQMNQEQQLITPTIIMKNIYINDNGGILVDVKMNINFEKNDSDYEASIILGIMFFSIILILSFVLCLLCNRYKELKKQIKYQDNVYKKIKQKKT